MSDASFTIDASVFVNAFSPIEPGSNRSLEFMERVRQKPFQVIVPTLLIPEVAAAIARKFGDAQLAVNLAGQIQTMPNLTLIPLDVGLARFSAETAAKHKLRGSGAVYAAVALRFGARLVTLDREQLARLGEMACEPFLDVNSG